MFYLHFGACQVVSNYSLSRFLNMGGGEGEGDGEGGEGGAKRTFGPSPPHSVMLVQNTVNEGNVVLLFFADLTIYIYM